MQTVMKGISLGGGAEVSIICRINIFDKHITPQQAAGLYAKILPGKL
jgi:hypothetical protein